VLNASLGEYHLFLSYELYTPWPKYCARTKSIRFYPSTLPQDKTSFGVVSPTGFLNFTEKTECLSVIQSFRIRTRLMLRSDKSASLTTVLLAKK
jgi:hypothetical protein